MVQLVKHLTLDFDLLVHEIQPQVRLRADCMDPTWDSLSPSPSAPPPLTVSLSVSLSLKINK